ncbi:hypothetical protein, partial [Oceanobacillus massiliensis]|uniref:hypothetical protein n=1 Tax=Oceanobacillus massiliensis TaxID=1465765 RepID=UPI000289AAE4
EFRAFFIYSAIRAGIPRCFGLFRGSDGNSALFSFIPRFGREFRVVFVYSAVLMGIPRFLNLFRGSGGNSALLSFFSRF